MVEGARLESEYAGDRIGGSNPLASAIILKIHPSGVFFCGGSAPL